MKFALSLLLASPCFAQTLSLTCPTGQVKVGTTLSIPVVLAGSGGGLTGLQFTATSTPSLGTLAVTSSGTAAAAAKSTFVSGTVVVEGGFGPPFPGTLNSNMIADGTIATLAWTVPTALANQTVTITLAGGALPLKATNAAGSLSGVSPGFSCAVSVLANTSLCDLDGNGAVDQSDVDAQRTMVMTFPQVAKCARDANGCWVGAIQIVATAALGGQCNATQ